MRVPRPIYALKSILTLCLFASLMVVAAPADAKPAKSYTSEQLTLLFSGAKVKATGDTCQMVYAGDLIFDFVFNTDGTFSVEYDCDTSPGVADAGFASGKWFVEDDELCMDFVKTTQWIESEACYSISRGETYFWLYFQGRIHHVWDLSISHPKFTSKEKLLAALGELAGKTAAKADLTLKPVEGPGGTGKARKAQAVTLPPAPYKAPPVSTKIKYDDRIYRVSRTDGYLTVYRWITGGKRSYLNAYALFGEYADDLYVHSPAGGVATLDIDSENKKKLEAFWPLEVGKKTSFSLDESESDNTPADRWTVSLNVSKAEILTLHGKNYETYVIDEEGRSDSGKTYVGRRWYDPAKGVIVKAERTWTKSFPVKGDNSKDPIFSEGEKDNYTLVRVRFPEGTIAVAAKKDTKAPPVVSTSETARLKQAAEKARAEATSKAHAQETARLKQAAEKARAEGARKALAQEIARLEREAAEKARAQEQAHLEREGEKARAEGARKAHGQEIARLKREAEAARKAREAEVSKVTATGMTRLKQEAEAVRRVHEAEIANLKRESEVIRKAREARETEIARLKREAEEVEIARLAEVARLKREAEKFQKALAERDALEAKVEKAHEIEIASLRRQLEEVLRTRKTAEALKAKATVADGLANIKFGNYHALVIGINNYKNLPKLTTAINDAKGVAKVLKDEYGFKVTTLIDSDRLDIIDAFDELQETLTDEDNLLIYYAGHGWLNEEVDRGYWLPVDAKPKRRSRWISNATITDTLKGLSAKHVMVLADSCYSGTLIRAANVGTRKRTGDYWKKMASKWARVAITSGGLEPVADKGGGGYSPFAKAFIDVLRDNVSIMDGMQLFSKMRRPVMVAADQTPQYADVRGAGHDGGDFLFVRKK